MPVIPGHWVHSLEPQEQKVGERFTAFLPVMYTSIAVRFDSAYALLIIGWHLGLPGGTLRVSRLPKLELQLGASLQVLAWVEHSSEGYSWPEGWCRNVAFFPTWHATCGFPFAKFTLAYHVRGCSPLRQGRCLTPHLSQYSLWMWLLINTVLKWMWTECSF